MLISEIFIFIFDHTPATSCRFKPEGVVDLAIPYLSMLRPPRSFLPPRDVNITLKLPSVAAAENATGGLRAFAGYLVEIRRLSSCFMASLLTITYHQPHIFFFRKSNSYFSYIFSTIDRNSSYVQLIFIEIEASANRCFQ